MMKRLLLLSLLVLGAITTARAALAPDPTSSPASTPTPTSAPVSLSPPVPQTPAPTSSALQSFFTPPTKPSSSESDNTNADTGLTSTASSDEDDDDMSPDEIRLWNWCKQNGVYVALGLAVLLLFLRAASKPPA